MNLTSSVFFEKGRGRWVALIRFTDPATGKLRSRKRLADTEHEAHLRLAELIDTLGVETEPETPRVGDLVEGFIESIMPVVGGSFIRREWLFGRFGERSRLRMPKARRGSRTFLLV